MKSLFLKDKFRRYLYKKTFVERLVLKTIVKDSTLELLLRYKALFLLYNLQKNSSIVRVRNRCLLTNRSRSIYKKFGLSRLAFRKLALSGELIGIRKASW